MSTWVEFTVTGDDWLWPNVNKEESPHLTLAYLGKEITGKQYEDVCSAVGEWYKTLLPDPNQELAILGYNVFQASAVIRVDQAGLEGRRDLLAYMIERTGVQVNRDFKFIPHVTIGKLPYSIKYNIQHLKLCTPELRVVHNRSFRTWSLK